MAMTVVSMHMGEGCEWRWARTVKGLRTSRCRPCGAATTQEMSSGQSTFVINQMSFSEGPEIWKNPAAKGGGRNTQYIYIYVYTEGIVLFLIKSRHVIRTMIRRERVMQWCRWFHRSRYFGRPLTPKIRKGSWIRRPPGLEPFESNYYITPRFREYNRLFVLASLLSICYHTGVNTKKSDNWCISTLPKKFSYFFLMFNTLRT